MSEKNIFNGFKYHKPVHDEYDTCVEDFKTFDAKCLWNFYNNISKKKYSISDIQESRASQIISALYDSKHKSSSNDIYADLAGSTPLHILSRRIPQINSKKEEIISELVKYRVPLQRALWFIYRVMSNFVGMPEIIKKKQKTPQENPTDWTFSLLEIMSKYLNVDEIKFSEIPFSILLEEWDYLFSIMLALYDANSIDHYEVMYRLVNSAENIFPYTKISSNTLKRLSTAMCSQLKFYLPYLLKFGRRFTESEVLTRRLLYWATSLMSNLIKIENITSLNFSNPNLQSCFSQFEELMVCPMHKVILLTLGGLIITLVLASPTSCVWNCVEYNQEFAFLCGSPLDLLPCPLALLPLAQGSENSFLRNYLIETEEFISQRSRLAENGWSPITDHSISEDTENFVRILNYLDDYDYNNASTQNFIEIMSNSICDKPFSSVYQCEILVRFLCEWAVTNHRSGLHRAIIVALILEYYKETAPPNSSADKILQISLIKFLEKSAPRYHSQTNYRSMESDSSFKSLICLFGELIDRQIFDHDQYVRFCITHGYIDSSFHPLANTHAPNAPLNSLTTNKNVFSIQSEMSEDNCNSVENPDSNRSEGGKQYHVGRSSYTLSRHLEYIIHFPLPVDDSYTHENNQRAQILYGSSRVRDRVKSRMKKIIRDIAKLFTKRVYLIDIVNGELGKKKKTKDKTAESAFQQPSEETRTAEDIHDDLMNRMKALSYYDMEYTISQCTPVYNKMFTTALLSDSASASPLTKPVIPGTLNCTPGSTNSRYLSLPNIIFLFFDLIEASLNMTLLITILSDTLSYLRLLNVSTDCAALYKSKVCLRIIGMLKRYRTIFVTMPDIQLKVFDDLLVHVKSVKSMQKCSPLERCVLMYLHDIYNSSYIFTKERGKYKTVLDKVAELFEAKKRYERKYNYLPDSANDIWSGNGEMLREFIRDFSDDPEKRFTFVVKAIKQVCGARSEEKLHHICILCNEVTAEYIALASDWLTVFYDILPNRTTCAYQDQIADIELDNQATYSQLTTLIENLLAYEYFSVNDLMRNVIFPTLAHIMSSDYDCTDCIFESSSRFAMYILYRLFMSDNISSLVHTTAHSQPTLSPNSYQNPSLGVRFSEPLLVNASMQRVRVDILVDALKLLILHSEKYLKGTDEILLGNGCLIDLEDYFDDPLKNGDALDEDGEDDSDVEELSSSFGYDIDDDVGLSGRKRRKCSQSNQNMKKRKKNRAGSSMGSKKKRNLAYKYIHIATKRYVETGQLPTEVELFNMRTSDFAHFLIRQICISEWVRRRLVGLTADKLLQKNVMIDKNITESQGRRLLHIMYWPKDLAWVDTASNESYISMQNLMSNLDIWHLRFSQMEYELQRKLLAVNSDRAIENVASHLVKKFHSHALGWLVSESSNNPESLITVNANIANQSQQPNHQLSEAFESYGTLPVINVAPTDSSWLLAPFVANVNRNLRTKIVQFTFEMLKGIKTFSQIKNDEEKERILLQNSVLLTHVPFFSMFKICIQECNECCDLLLEQIDCFVQNAKETEDRVPDNNRIWQIIQQCLSLRLILMGHKIVKSDIENEFVLKCINVLAQLIIFGVVEPDSNQQLFFMTLDMLHNLFHCFIAKAGFTHKNFQKILKSLRKDIAEKPSNAGIEYIRPLMAISKNPPSFYVYGVSPYSTTEVSKKSRHKDDKAKGNLITKKGYAVTRRESCTFSWLIEPQKLHLLYKVYGSVFCHSQPFPWTITQANLLISHNHPTLLTRPLSYFMEPIVDNNANHYIERVMRKFIEKYLESRIKKNDQSKKGEYLKLKGPSMLQNKSINDAIKGNPHHVIQNYANHPQNPSFQPHHGQKPSQMTPNKMANPYSGPGPRSMSFHEAQNIQSNFPNQMSIHHPPMAPQGMNPGMMPGQNFQPNMFPQRLPGPSNVRPMMGGPMSMMSSRQMAPSSIPNQMLPQQPFPQQQQPPPPQTTTPPKRKRASKAKTSTTPNKMANTANQRNMHPQQVRQMMPNTSAPNSQGQMDTYTFSAGNSNSGGSMTGWNQNDSVPNHMGHGQQQQPQGNNEMQNPHVSSDYPLRGFLLQRQYRNNQQQQSMNNFPHEMDMNHARMGGQMRPSAQQMIPNQNRPQMLPDHQNNFHQNSFRQSTQQAMPDPPPYHGSFDHGQMNQQQQQQQMNIRQMNPNMNSQMPKNQCFEDGMNQNFSNFPNQQRFMQ